MSAEHSGHSGRPRVRIPLDEEAEECVIGIAIGSADGARLAGDRLAPEDFYRRDYGRVLEVATQLTGIVGEDRRISTIGRLTGLRETQLRRLVECRPCMFDRNGSLAARVKDAARRRRVMALAAELYNGAASQSLAELRESTRELLDEIEALSEPPVSQGDRPL